MSNSYKTKTVGYDGDENLNANAIFLSAPKLLLKCGLPDGSRRAPNCHPAGSHKAADYFPTASCHQQTVIE